MVSELPAVARERYKHATQVARCHVLVTGVTLALSTPASATSILYSNLNVNMPNAMATASRPEPASGGLEIESADDFILNIASRSLRPVSSVLSQSAPMSMNEPRNLSSLPQRQPESSKSCSGSDASEFAVGRRVCRERRGVNHRDRPGSQLHGDEFRAERNHCSMTPMTGGDGPVTGQEVRFDVVFLNPFVLPADHYFFVPQVGLTSGNFFWLSAARPIPNGSPNTPINPDLQEWIRNGKISIPIGFVSGRTSSAGTRLPRSTRHLNCAAIQFLSPLPCYCSGRASSESQQACDDARVADNRLSGRLGSVALKCLTLEIRAPFFVRSCRSRSTRAPAVRRCNRSLIARRGDRRVWLETRV